jgi:hypothetical protein
MARLTIDTGTAGNPATGDTLRTAMTKVNTNFTELYDSELLSLSQGLLKTVLTNGDIKIQPNGTGQVEIDQLLITSDSITSLVTNGDVTLAGNGTGNVIVEAITVNGTTLSSTDSTKITLAENVDITGNLVVGGTLDLSDTNFTNVGSIALDTITNDGTNITLDSSGDIVLDAGGGDVFLKDSGTLFATFTNNGGNLTIKNGATAALTFSGANVTAEGNLTVDGNLDVTGTLDLSDSNFTNVGALQLDSIAGDGDTNTSITFSGSDVITIATGGSGRLTIGDGALTPVTDNQIDLGTSSLEFKDAYFDGTVTSDAFAGPLTGAVTGNADTATTSTNVTVADESSDTTCFPLFTTAASGDLPPKSGTNLTFNSSSGVLTATGFIGALTGTASIASAVVVADESSDTTCFPLFASGATSGQAVKSGSNLTFNSSTGIITATGFAGALTGNVTGNTSGTAATVTGAAQTNITSLGTLTALQVDNININGNAITSTAGTDLTITPVAGQQIVLDGTIVVDAGVVTGATSITSDVFVGPLTGAASIATTVTVSDNESTNENNVILFAAGAAGSGNLGVEADGNMTYNPSTGKITATGFIGALTGNVTGNTSGTAATVTGAAQTNITSVGTLTALQVDNLNLNGNTLSSTAGTDLLITPLAGQQIVLDGAIVVDAGVVTGATSITSTAFVGALTGNATGTAATVTGAAQTNITSVGTLTALQVDNLNINGNAITSTAGTDLTITPLAGQQIVLDGTIVVDAGVVTGATSITSTALVGTTLSVSGLTNLTGSFSQAIHTFVATDAITQSEHAGRILLLGEVGGNADVVLTLPDATGTGNVYEFIVSVTMASNTYKIACPDADNTITGTMQYLDLDGTAVSALATAATSDTITLNGGTQGGQVGDTLKLIDIAANKWMVQGQMRVPAGANPATPFSAAVS